MNSGIGPVRVAINTKYDRKMKLETDPWWDFNNSFSNLSLDNADQFNDHIAAGHSFCAQHEHVHRTKDDGAPSAYRYHLNWMPTSTLPLDFDRGDVDLEHLEHDPIVGGFIWHAYATTSWTEAMPRVRLVLATKQPIKRIDTYGKVLQALAHHLSTADRMSTNPVMAYAGNTNKPLRHIAPNRRIPTEVLRRLLADYEEIQRLDDEQRRANLSRYRSEIPGAEEVARMLECIPMHQEYLEWVKILMAVHSAYPDEVGIQLCEAWSPGRKHEVRDKFRSFHRSSGVGIGTLYHAAHANGYRRATAEPTSYYGAVLNRAPNYYGRRN